MQYPGAMKSILFLLLVLLFQVSFATKVTNLSEIQGKEETITEIDLSNKGLTVFPAEIWKCKNLQKLNLSQNGLVSIPIEITELKQLKSLNLSKNQSLNPIDLDLILAQAQFQLTELNLQGCNLIAMPESIVQHKGLQSLNVSENRFKTLPAGMMNLTKLKDVNLSNNELVDVSWVLNYWWSLKRIDFSMNTTLKSSLALESLSYYDQLDRIVISHVSELPENFEILNVSHLIIQKSVLTKWNRGNLSNQIKVLQFDACNFENLPKIVENMNTFKTPDKLILSNMDAFNITGFLALQADSLKMMNITNLNLTPLKDCKKLKFLDIRSCKVSKSDLDNLKSLRPDLEIMATEGVPDNKGIHPPIQKFIPKPIEKTVDVSETATLSLGQSIVTIPKGSIVDKNGNPVTEPITMSYTEYMNPADIFLSGINMTLEEEGETMMFSSGGMFNLTATDNSGNEVFVNPEKPIAVQLFTPSENPEMSLYKLDKNGVWKLEGKDDLVKPFEYDQAKIDSILNLDFEDMYYEQIQVITDRYVPVFKKDRKYKTFTISMRYYAKHTNISRRASLTHRRYYMRDYIANFLTEQTMLFEGDSAEYYFSFLDSISKVSQEKYEYLRIPKTHSYRTIGPNYFYDYKIKPNYEQDNFSLIFNYKDSVLTIPFNLVPTGTPSNMVSSTNSFYKKYTRSWLSNKKLRTKTDNLIKNRLEIGKKELKKKAVEEEKARQELLAQNAEYMSQSAGIGSMTRAFNMNGFGTWNCDVRSRMVAPTPLNTDFVSAANERMSAIDKKVAVIDKDLNSTIQFENGKEAFFDNANRNVIIVFFSTALVGVYQTIKHNLTKEPQQLQLIDISNMSKETFANIILNEF